MEELKTLWREVSSKGVQTSTPAQIHKSVVRRSSAPAEALLKGIRIKGYFAIGFALFFGAIVPFAMPVVSQYLLLVIFAAYLIGAILLWQEYNILKGGLDMSMNLREGLTAYYSRIKKVLYYEELIALCLYPICAASGFLLGMQWMAGAKSILNNTASWLIFTSVILVMTISGYFLARWLNQRKFGPYLQQLKDNIDELIEDSTQKP